FGWHKWVGTEGDVHCLDHFGASAPMKDLAREFGFTVEAVVGRAKKLLGRGEQLNRSRARPDRSPRSPAPPRPRRRASRGGRGWGGRGGPGRRGGGLRGRRARLRGPGRTPVASRGARRRRGRGRGWASSARRRG